MNASEQAEAVRLHVEEGLTFAAIGRRFGVTRERIRQVVAAQGQRSLTHERQRAESSYKRIARAVAVAAGYELRSATSGTHKHGTRSSYVHAGCRCDECRAAQRAYMRTLRGRTPPTHSYSGYTNYGCRCAVCTQANTDKGWLRGPTI